MLLIVLPTTLAVNLIIEKLAKLVNIQGFIGLVVETRTPGREVGGSIPTSPCCVLEQRHIYSPKSTGNTQEVVAPS